MKDMHSKMTLVTAIGAAVLSADAPSGLIDLQGYNSAEIVLAIGIGGIAFSAANKIEFVLTHGDAADGSDQVAVTDTGLLGVTGTANGIIKALVAAQAAAGSYRFGYKGGKRYLKLLADFSGAHATGTPIAAMVIKGSGFNKPEADQA